MSLLDRMMNKGQKAHHEPVTGLSSSVPLESPYLAARREWNERYGSYIAQARTWQRVAIASIGLAAVLAVCLVNVASQSKVKPYIVEVDKLGQAVAVKPADVAEEADQRIVRSQLANFIANARNVTPDPIVQKRWLDAAYGITGPSASAYLDDFYNKKRDPFSVGRTSTIAAEIQPPLPLSKTTWQLQWTETRRGLNGQAEGVPLRFQAILTVGTFPPETVEQITANPTGLVIEQISWTQQL